MPYDGNCLNDYADFVHLCQLCATGSITGAASVGYVFGQHLFTSAAELADLPPPKTPDSQTRTYKPRKVQQNISSNRPGTPGPSSQHLSPFDTPHSVQNSHHTRSTAATEQSLKAENGVGDCTSSPKPDSVQETTDNPEYRPSRLQKLASFTFSSRSSPTTSLRFDARSLALSSESTAPLFKSDPYTSPAPRNKLVKRSLSQHLVDRHGINESTFSRYTLTRPATRHTRRETLSKHHFVEQSTVNSLTDSAIQTFYKPHFQPKITLDRLSSISKQHAQLTIRRICPGPARRSLLLPPKFLLPLQVELDFNPDNESEPITSHSTLNTPPPFPHFHSSPGPSFPPIDSETPKIKSRRSFSIGDLLSRAPSTPRSSSGKNKTSKKPQHTPSSVTMQHSRQPETPRKRIRRGEKRPSPSQPSDGSRLYPQSSSLVDGEFNEHDDRITQGHNSTAEVTSSNRESGVSFPSQLSLNRRSRRSITPSDNASSQVGSDIDAKIFSSADEDEGDKRSDSLYDSLRTGATRSSSGFRGPPLETLFDKESAVDAPSRLMDEQGTESTPSKSTIPDHRDSGISPEATDMPLTQTIPSSSPPVVKSLRLGALAWDSDLGDEDSFWSHDEQEEDWDDEGRSDAYAATSEAKGVSKSNLFDWSEPQLSHARPSESHLSRPKTVHGKKIPSGRPSRSTGRRTPSGLHARSQSVPVLADLAGDHVQMTNKFGTWGVGSKGVAEDWNDDFEFDEFQSRPESSGNASSNVPATGNTTMVVPDAIREQQTNVLANIKLLKEWGIIIEELKDMRERTTFLGLQGDQYRDLFDEVDAMIELADQEADGDEIQPQLVTNSSPAADFDGFGNRNSSPMLRESSQTARGEGDAIGDSRSSTPAKLSPSTRPRKNSQAVAQSVIEAIQSRRRVPHPTSVPSTPTRKVPFDTTTLRHIVPHVSGLSKRLKQVLYDAEGLQVSPKRSLKAREPSLSKAFIEPGGSESGDESEEVDESRSNENNNMNELVKEMKSTNLR